MKTLAIIEIPDNANINDYQVECDVQKCINENGDFEHVETQYVDLIEIPKEYLPEPPYGYEEDVHFADGKSYDWHSGRKSVIDEILGEEE